MSDKSNPSGSEPIDLLSIIGESGVLTERQFLELKSKVLRGDYPHDANLLAERLVKDNLLTDYQVGRFLRNKPHGLIVGRYVILERLGAGSMGRVYKARHDLMDRLVALKIIAPEIVSNERVVARFQREMKLVGRLDHPNVVRAFDADRINSILFIVMEYVAGQSLGQRMRKGPIPPAEMAQYAAQAALGLQHAHVQGIVHRDIKPSNLLLNGDRQIKVLDLGLGVLMEADNQATFATADGIAVGTVDYMSPEQACGREVDGRSDLFSLGCSMYHLMTGRLPFPGQSPIERLGKRINGRPVPILEVKPDIPVGLVQVLDRLMAHKPQDRYATAGEAAEALQSLLRPRVKAPAAGGNAVSRSESSRVTSPTMTTSPAAEPKAVAAKSPTYPSWFRPMADLAERKPKTALAAMLIALGAVFGCGFVLARLLG